jgi:formylglycine-generating enzyme required for sulfatase activity
MALVVGGAATVGHDGGPPESSPPITVVLDSFYMDLTETTVGRYQEFRKLLRAEPSRKSIAEPLNADAPAEYPVLGVTVLEAQFYARWAGKEIPTEAEWERAARGEQSFIHPWGNGRAIWKQARSREEIGPVKAYATDCSPFGIYDLAGNAREWCSDRYSPTAFAEAARLSPERLRNWKGARLADPAGTHVVKGNGPRWEAWHRQGAVGSERGKDIGFRCVLRIATEKKP